MCRSLFTPPDWVPKNKVSLFPLVSNDPWSAESLAFSHVPLSPFDSSLISSVSRIQSTYPVLSVTNPFHESFKMDPTPHTPLKKELILRCSPKSYAALSPTSKEKVINLKRKASELSETEIPKDTNEFFVWRLATIKCLLEEAEAAVEGFREALSIGKEKDITELESEIQEKQREIEVLQKEQSILLQEGKLIKEDCQDSPEQVEDAYMNALYTKFLKDSEEGRRYLKKNKTTWSRDTFKTRVAEFLDSRGHQEHEGELFCNILGEWIPKKYVKCAHIVNYSFEGREIDYLFGSENNALKSERNGLYLVAAFEENFDGGNVTIVPDGSLDEQPIEWKAVILNESLLDKTLYGQIKWRVSSS